MYRNVNYFFLENQCSGFTFKDAEFLVDGTSFQRFFKIFNTFFAIYYFIISNTFLVNNMLRFFYLVPYKNTKCEFSYNGNSYETLL